MKGERLGMIVLGILTIILLATIITIRINTSRDDDNDGKDHMDEEVPIVPQLIVMDVKEAFTTDKLSSRMVPNDVSHVWLVLKVELTNKGNQSFNFSGSPVYLRHRNDMVFPYHEEGVINNILTINSSIPVNGSVEGWVHFDIKPTTLNLVLNVVDDWNAGFYGSYNLTGMEFDHRPWKTPLTIVIDECGRDGPGDPHPGIFYMNITVENNNDNATIFEYWHMRLNVTGEGVRDVMFGTMPEDTSIYGGESRKYTLYFDINVGSPELPETLYEPLNWIFVDVDPQLYSDHI